MDRARVVPALLESLDKSPLWPWDAPPAIWAVVNEDPTILMIAFSVPTLGHLVGIAQAWRDQMPADSVPMEGLILIHEGWVQPLNEDGTPVEGVRHETRDAILAEKDGTVSLFRHTRNGSVEEVELDPTAPSLPSVEAMREVAAASWRD